jgi:uncharacterized repeat protein (TIGR01451 family)
MTGMRRELRIVVVVLALWLLISMLLFQVSESAAAPLQGVQPPRLKWKWGGCFTDWCETGWYSSPAVADLDGDGRMEIVGSGYSLFSLDGATGKIEWRVAAGQDRSVPFRHNPWRTYSGIVIADLDADGKLEIATGHDSGYVSVYNNKGYFEPGWPQRPTPYEPHSLAAYDIDRDGRMELIMTADVRDPVNTWVFEPDGSLRPGWPQWPGAYDYAAGTYNDSMAVGDMDGDGMGEIVVPSDFNNIAAYEHTGRQVPANPVFNVSAWGKVNHFESPYGEIRGWLTCRPDSPRSERNVSNFELGAAVIVDVDGDGTTEVVASGDIYDCTGDRRPSEYQGIWIFNADRSRYNKGGNDWRTPPVDTGAPLSEDFDTIRLIRPNPVVVDLDGDGKREILYPTFDGRLHAFWLDKTEHYQWPYSVYKAGGVIRFASEPVVADLDNDGHPEVIFASWPEARDNLLGKLHILDYKGNPLYELALPPSWSRRPPDNWNGGQAAPTLDDIDGDGELEAVLNTAHSGLVAYDLPGTANARVLWGTGRWNYQRTASLLTGSLELSRKAVTPTTFTGAAVLNYTIALVNAGPVLPDVRITDTLPAEVTYLGNLDASDAGNGLTAEVGADGRTVVTWRGAVSPGRPITITYAVAVTAPDSAAQSIRNTVHIDDGAGTVFQRAAVAIAGDAHQIFLPIITSKR